MAPPVSNPVSKNVAAALGLVPTVLGGVRRLPGKAVQLPVIAVGTALAGLDAARREYDDLAERGERLISRLRGVSFEELEEKVEHTLLSNGSAANAKAAVKEAAGQVADQVEAAKSVTAAKAAPPAKAAAPVQETLPVAEPSTGKVDSAASPEVIEQVEKIAHNVDAPLITDHDDLPLPDYDHMTLGSLRGRLRSLDMQQLVQLRDYEKSKADRLPVITMLDNRIAKLSNGESTPTGTPPAAPAPAAAKAPKTVGGPAGPKGSTPPRTKVRST